MPDRFLLGRTRLRRLSEESENPVWSCDLHRNCSDSVLRGSGDPVVSGTFVDKHFWLSSVEKRSGDPAVSETFAEDDGREV